MRQRPPDLSIPADRGEPFPELRDRLVDCALRDAGLAGDGRRGRQEQRRHGRRGEEDGDDTQHERRPGDGDDQRPQERVAGGERRLERQVEDPHRGLELRCRDDPRDHRRLGRREHDRREADAQVQEQQERDVRAGEGETERQQGPDRIREDHCPADVEAVDEHARDGRQHDRRDEVGHDEGADGRVRAG